MSSDVATPSMSMPMPMAMPVPIERSVRKQNIKFQHTYNQFSSEFFQFMRKVAACQTPYLVQEKANHSLDPGQVEELAQLSVEIAARFLFTTCLHTKKSLRGVANEW